MNEKSVAIFIDAENIPAKYAKTIFDIASDYGEVIIRRIYGDWTKENIQSWKEQIAQYSIIAMQQFNFTASKNASDMYLITEVLSIFYEKDIDVFIIVSSDSDYTKLVQKLRENKKQIIGIGFEKSILSYVNSFSEFFYLDTDENEEVKEHDEHNKKLINDLNTIISKLIDEKGRAEYSQIRMVLVQKYPNFSPKKFGFKNFRALIHHFLPKMKDFKEANEKNVYFLERTKKWWKFL